MEDGEELSRKYHRHALNCGTLDADNNLVDTVLTDEHAEVQAVCNAVWTQSIKDAYRTFLASQNTELGE
jgi:hypothetical protein